MGLRIFLVQNTELAEVGMRTRRRPIGRDYAAAKDAEGGHSAKGSRKNNFTFLTPMHPA